MLPDETPEEAHARAIRAAERQDMVDELIRAFGIDLPDEPITRPIPVIRIDDEPGSWLSAG
ncbi:putative protein OS=Tsukamurella paurometabola (strain ATCC 8368 / DSM / CCUG 35730 /CIP 100753 / JCM 10117 / KCTC 9821 / NBRC 16120 / NCIMB 702349/ NCTC 13040) OX=521096 GN=Tpau_0875 PE=4 SV=1 [Tsukamurella paurometabola]|uniref:Uncharacterized protein n=1 Tax=Tsukamurella paurometabola (strain ATCC 8368 / DSM 20162 / CCUG 35730 / CIP 100753 / JCM 10117 / KCTC 9821 / NBRC 16120 / NCIMB 702349 / NCTC 13040) TaxID=521096 RepID=D5UUD8_TSUPD|nr:hypothetical protein [Tsukamurella paurometabola]ADG77509.1 hypothetical protein Tpau_0875 [Tsukamurella paurometabola DSM 20162]SUP27486.1 Uncharacterised protein [Tsukamurella paurometabola]